MMMPAPLPPVIQVAAPASTNAQNSAAPVTRPDAAAERTGQVPETAAKPTQPGTVQRPPAEPHLLGDWAGLRPRAIAAGITPTIGYVGIGLANLTGGARRDATWADQWAFGLGLDLPRLLGLPGTVQVTVSKRGGPHIVAKAGLGMQLSPQEIYGRGEIWRVTQGWYRVTAAGVEAKLGRMTLSEDYSVLRCDFASLYLCGAHNGQVAPNIWFNWPVSAWGARVRVAHGELGFVQTGIYQVNPRDIDSDRTLFVGFAGGRAINVPVEVSYTPKLGRRGLPGTYRLGAWYTNAADADPVLDAAGGLRAITGGAPLIHRGQVGWYAAARQQIIPPAGDGAGALTAFVGTSFFTRKTATLERIVGAGMNYSGPIPGRPRDEIGVGIGNSRRNARISDAQRTLVAIGASAAPVRTNEWLLEGYYGIAAAPGLVLRPDVQFAIDPGGTSTNPGVLLVGLKTVVTL